MSPIYRFLSRFTSQKPPPPNPQRILLIRPCCIGDVVLATASLQALRRAYPQAHMTWAVGSWSKRAIEHHPDIDAFLDAGDSDMPVRSVSEFWRFVRQLRAGQYDLAILLVRSPLMSLALQMSGIPYRVGLDSEGRGFGYTIRVPVDPNEAKHEAEIYLETVRAIGGNTQDCRANIPILDSAIQTIQDHKLPERFIVIHPGGGSNPGMVMSSKRWLPQNFAQLGEQLSQSYDAELILIGGPHDGAIVDAVQKHLSQPARTFIGELSFAEIGALAEQALLYIGNDSGLTHLAAASGGKTVMIFGPSDPRRYAPFTDDSLALWKPYDLQGGVSERVHGDWDWERDGIDVETAFQQITMFLSQKSA